MEKNLILTRAQGAVLSRDFTTAVRLYKQLLDGDPSNVDYLKEVGSIYVKAGEDEKAIPYYEQIIMFYPHYIEAMNALGAIFRRLKRYEESVSILQKALEEGRQIPSVNYNLGFTYKEMGQYDDAIEAFDYVIAEKPDDVLAYNHLGVLYLAKKEYQKSISSFKRGLQVDPNHPILNYNLARCYDECKMYSESIRCYQSALKAKPGWLDAVKDFSSLLVKCQQTKEAADLVSHSIELHPNDVKLLCLLGNIYLNQYDFDAAVKTFKKAKAYKATDVEVLTGLAQALEKDEFTADSLNEIEQALEIEPENKDVKKQYVSSLLSANELESAHANVDALYNDNGDKDAQVLDLYGQYYICSGNEEKAKEMFDKIPGVNRHYKNHMLGAAERYNQIGKTAKALEMANSYIARDSKNSAGYNMLGKIYTKSGIYQQAIESYEKSRAISGVNVFADKQLGSLRIKAELLANEIQTPLPVAAEEEVAVENTVEQVVEPQQPVEEEKTSEEFDFAQMGDNMPLAEALPEEEAAFFDSLDEEEQESEEENESLLDNLDNDEKFDFDGFDDFGSSMGGENPYLNGDDGGTEGLTPQNEQDSAQDAAALDEASAPEMPPQDSAMPKTSQETTSLEPVPQSSGISEEQVRNLEDRLRDSTEQAMLAAMDAQRKVRELEAEQEKLRLENEELVQKVVEKALDERVAEKQNEDQSDLQSEDLEENQSEKFEDELDDDTLFGVDELFDDLNESEESEGTDVDEQEEPKVTDVDGMDGIDEDFLETEAFSESTEEALVEDAPPEDAPAEEPPAQQKSDVPVLSPQTMLEKIEAILKDDNTEKAHEAELGLFLKLKQLCEFLPESEKDSFNSCRARMLIEFLISKYSGKPGLLVTATSLLKSGVLGEQFSCRLSEDIDEDLSNELIKKVIISMKKLSFGLEDKSLQTALCISADGILEQIELENQKSQIF